MRKIFIILIGLFLLTSCSNSPVTKDVGVSIPTGGKDMHTTTEPLPLEGKTIVLDPGHGGMDPGAVANELVEKELNLTIALLTKELLENKGANVYLTRTDDSKLSFAERINFSRKYNADIFVSIHHNTNEVNSVHGTEVYYNEFMHEGEVNPYPEESKELALHIHDRLSRGASLNPLGVKEDYYFVLRQNTVPSVLVEVAFVTNEADAARLSNSEELELFSKMIFEGIYNYLIGVGTDQYVNQ